MRSRGSLGLKPPFLLDVYGAAEAAPLQSFGEIGVQERSPLIDKDARNRAPSFLPALNVKIPALVAKDARGAVPDISSLNESFLEQIS